MYSALTSVASTCSACGLASTCSACGSHKYDLLVKRQINLGTTNHARNYVGWGLFFEQFLTCQSSAVTIFGRN
jgi:hypothetical protein